MSEAAALLGDHSTGLGGARDLREAGAGGRGPCASGQTQPVSVTTFSSGLDAHLPQEKVAEMLLTARVVQAVACGTGPGCGSTGTSRNSPEGASPTLGRLGSLGAQDHWRREGQSPEGPVCQATDKPAPQPEVPTLP